MTATIDRSRIEALEEMLPHILRPLGVTLVDVTQPPASSSASIHIEYTHHRVGSPSLEDAIIAAVTGVAAGVSRLDHVPERVDVTATSTDDEPPLKYHITRSQAHRAADGYLPGNDTIVLDVFEEIADNAEQFVTLS